MVKFKSDIHLIKSIVTYTEHVLIMSAFSFRRTLVTCSFFYVNTITVCWIPFLTDSGSIACTLLLHQSSFI
jgi:hypothetical protein